MSDTATPAVPALGTPAAADVTPAVVAPAAPAAPVTPPVPATVADPAKGDVKQEPAGDEGAVSYAETGDGTLDVALAFVGRLGIGPEDAAMQAATRGDFSLLKAKLASLGQTAQGWEQFVALGEKAFSTFSATEATKAEATQAAVFEVAGGPEAWKEISAWATANADPEEKDQINAMFAQGGLAARAAASFLANSYYGTAGVTKQPVDAAGHVPNGSHANHNSPLSPDEYRKAVAAGARNGISRAEQEALDQRRLAWRG